MDKKELDVNLLSPIEDFGKETQDGIYLGTYNNIDELLSNFETISNTISAVYKEIEEEENSIQKIIELICKKCGKKFLFGRTGWELKRGIKERNLYCLQCSSEEEVRKRRKYTHLGKWI